MNIRRALRLATLVVGLAALTGVGLLVVQAQVAATLYLVPGSPVVDPGDVFTISMRVSDPGETTAWQAGLTYDSAVITPTGTYTMGNFLVPNHPQSPIPLATFEEGQCTFAMAQQCYQMDCDVASQDGELVEIEFEALADGITPLNVVEAVLVAPGGQEQDLTTVDGSVQVGMPTPTHTPEPTATGSPEPTPTNTPEPTPTETPEGNLLENGDFEAGSLDGWKDYSETGVQVSAAAARRGQYGASHAADSIATDVTVVAGERYEASAWVRLDEVIAEPTWGGYQLCAVSIQPDWSWDWLACATLTGTYEWEHMSLMVEPTSDRMKFILRNYHDGALEVSVDDAYLAVAPVESIYLPILLCSP